MRARRVGLVGLALLVGVSLVRSSISSASGAARVEPTLDLRVSGDPEGGPDLVAYQRLWVRVGPPARTWSGAERALPSPHRWLDAPWGIRVLLRVGAGRPRAVLTNATTVRALVAALGVRLRPLDLVRPSLPAPLYSGMRLRVVRIRVVVRVVVEEVAFPNVVRYSNRLERGRWRLLAAGRAGRVLRTYLVRYQNGRPVSRTLVSERVLAGPVARVVLRGTAPPVHATEVGQASWYDFCPVDGNYAAHPSLPFGTRVTVTNLDNGRSVTVVINDRGPFGVPGRIIDLCESAFARIAPLGQGVANVRISW
jgi:hypothetical protein